MTTKLLIGASIFLATIGLTSESKAAGNLLEIECRNYDGVIVAKTSYAIDSRIFRSKMPMNSLSTHGFRNLKFELNESTGLLASASAKPITERSNAPTVEPSFVDDQSKDEIDFSLMLDGLEAKDSSDDEVLAATLLIKDLLIKNHNDEIGLTNNASSGLAASLAVNIGESRAEVRNLLCRAK